MKIAHIKLAKQVLDNKAHLDHLAMIDFANFESNCEPKFYDEEDETPEYQYFTDIGYFEIIGDLCVENIKFSIIVDTESDEMGDTDGDVFCFA
jgi:hypothetical protein